MSNNAEIATTYNRFIEDQSQERLGVNFPAYMLHTEQQNANFFFGTRYNYGTKKMYFIGKPQDRDGHILVVGGAGSGKSSCIAIPTLSTWDGTFFAIDIKGELSKNWPLVKKANYPVKIFDFSREKEKETFRYDPFYLLHEGNQDDLVQNAREIAQAIIPILPNVQEPFWSQAAQHVLTAVILYVCGLEEHDPSTGELLQGTFNDAMVLIQSKPIWELIEEISKSGNESAIMHINQFREIKDPEDNKMLAGISAELSNHVIAFATDNRIQSAFTKDDAIIKWEDLKDHNIFMRIPEDKLGQWDGAITMMLTQLIRTLERRPDRYNDKEKLPPILLLLDEFPRLGKIDVIQNAVSTLRSKGVTICLIVQSLAQLDKIYGKESRQIIVDNCQYKAILNVTDSEDQKIFSDMIGSITVSKKGVNDSLGLSHGVNTGSTVTDAVTFSDGKSQNISRSISANMSVTREPTILPHELGTLKDILLLTPEGFCRVDKYPYYGVSHWFSVDQAQIISTPPV